MCCVLCRDKARFPVGKGIAGYVADTAETLNVANVYEVELQTKVYEEKARAFSWLNVPPSAFTFKTLLRHYAKRALTPRSLNVKLGPRRKGHKGRAVWLA